MLAAMSATKEVKDDTSPKSLLRRRSSVFDLDATKSAMKSTSMSESMTEFLEYPSQIDLSQQVAWENSYRMEPRKRMEAFKVEAVIKETLEKYIGDDAIYDAKTAPQMAKTCSSMLTTAVKELGYTEYKIVCVVTVGQVNGQGVRMGSRCLSDSKHDTWASSSFKNTSLFATAQVYGIYYE